MGAQSFMTADGLEVITRQTNANDIIIKDE